jgi:hypothetical protein
VFIEWWYRDPVNKKLLAVRFNVYILWGKIKMFMNVRKIQATVVVAVNTNVGARNSFLLPSAGGGVIAAAAAAAVSEKRRPNAGAHWPCG